MSVAARLLNASTGRGRIALITGGASGLGAATAKLFARHGAGAVVITDLPRQRAASEAIAAEISKTSPSCKVLVYDQDVTKESEWEKLFSSVGKELGPIDISVNSAGVALLEGPLETLSVDTWSKVIDVNLTGTFLGIKHSIVSMRENKAKELKSIINLSSIEGIIGDPMIFAYSASKGGVRILTKSAALYCAEQKLGIRINSIHPGFIDTPMVRNAFDAVPDGQMRKALYDDITSRHPLGRLGVAQDIANAALFLASDESSFMTGTEFVVDGGYTAK
ncbi:3-oxoacyl-acyl carrier protein reductase [Hyaloraphidium curvatum]|nr:3-oxoacyl-acyl carrier protein reductase [Hyaloraphidium curvatum]